MPKPVVEKHVIHAVVTVVSEDTYFTAHNNTKTTLHNFTQPKGFTGFSVKIRLGSLAILNPKKHKHFFVPMLPRSAPANGSSSRRPGEMFRT